MNMQNVPTLAVRTLRNNNTESDDESTEESSPYEAAVMKRSAENCHILKELGLIKVSKIMFFKFIDPCICRSLKILQGQLSNTC